MDIIILGIVIIGMWGAFYLGSRKERKLIEKEYSTSPENMDIPLEPTEEEYMKSLKSWKINSGETEETG